MNALEQFTPLMDAVISHIHEGVILTDYKGKILFHNPAADELLGFPKFDSVGEIQAATGIDALAHCVEAYVGMNDPYHPYYEALALYGVSPGVFVLLCERSL